VTKNGIEKLLKCDHKCHCIKDKVFTLKILEIELKRTEYCEKYENDEEN
jgi:hypothetical protein